MIELIHKVDVVHTISRIVLGRIVGISNDCRNLWRPASKPISEPFAILLYWSLSIVIRNFILIVFFRFESRAVVITPCDLELSLTGLIVLSHVIDILSHISNFRFPTDKVVRAITNRRIFDNIRNVRQFRSLGTVCVCLFTIPVFSNRIIEINIVTSFLTQC